MSKSPIEWTEHTWNPIVGCSIVSPGCTNCYAMKMAARLDAINEAAAYADKYPPSPHYAGITKKVNGKAVWTGKLALAPDSILLQPLKRKKPTTFFVNSMGDLFHEDCPDEWIDKVFAVMALSPQHTFQVLTKRAGRMRDYLAARNGMGNAKLCKAINDIPAPLGNRRGALEMPLPNCWLGVSTERQQEADERIPLLLQTPAAVRFISAEPLLGAIDLEDIVTKHAKYEAHRSALECDVAVEDDEEFHGATLDWVITGGESGPGARPSNPQWYRDIRDQCARADVAYFHKQNGAWVSVSEVEGPGEHFSFPDGRTVRHVGKVKAGRKLDGIEHNGLPALTAWPA